MKWYWWLLIVIGLVFIGYGIYAKMNNKYPFKNKTGVDITGKSEVKTKTI
jgi:hypothetical protein